MMNGLLFLLLTVTVCVCVVALTYYFGVRAVARSQQSGLVRNENVISNQGALPTNPFNAGIILLACLICLVLIALMRWQSSVEMMLLAVFLVFALSASIIDSRTKLLLDSIVQPMLWVGLFINCFDAFVSLHQAVAGAMVGFFVMWSISILYKLVIGESGVGFGDVKFIAAIGAWFGPAIVLIALVLSSLSFVLYALFFRRQKIHAMNESKLYPMGGFLAAGGFVCELFHLDRILKGAF